MISATPIDSTQVILAMITALPGFIMAAVAALISWHNRDIAKDTNAKVGETKLAVNGRMDQLLESTKILAAAQGRASALAEASTARALGDSEPH